MGRNDPCPCGSGRRFPPVLPVRRSFRRHQRPLLRPGLTDPALGPAPYMRRGPFASPPARPAARHAAAPAHRRSGQPTLLPPRRSRSPPLPVTATPGSPPLPGRRHSRVAATPGSPPLPVTAASTAAAPGHRHSGSPPLHPVALSDPAAAPVRVEICPEDPLL
ncbi:SEC-C metal-binding domain-containing protein [Actinoplanes sp. NPDC049265]|uniref:SEC-C metal-binding domain-containing protein n=1 Tax=Actinoplanes sp. NPDC049265 TaxID=3363902 RepID=UPI003716FFDA